LGTFPDPFTSPALSEPTFADYKARALVWEEAFRGLVQDLASRGLSIQVDYASIEQEAYLRANQYRIVTGDDTP
jgi:hypothetical protein